MSHWLNFHLGPVALCHDTRTPCLMPSMSLPDDTLLKIFPNANQHAETLRMFPLL